MAIYIGSASANKYKGTTAGDTVSGVDKNDTLSGLAGNDTINGGMHNDSLLGGIGNDEIFGEDGLDILIGGLGNDTLSGGNGNDLFREFSLDGSDLLSGGNDFDTVTYDDNIKVNPITFIVSTSTALRNGETDTLSGIEKVVATDSTLDTIDSSQISSGVTINLTTGLISATGSDVVQVLGFEKVIGTTFDDTITGNSLNNTIMGGSGNDSLSGGDGDDTYTFQDNFGNDVITDSSGNDTFDFSMLTNAVQISLFSTLHNSLGGTSTIETAFNVIENIIGTSKDDTLQGNERNNHLLGNDSNDTLTGFGGNDTLAGGKGNDTYIFSGKFGKDLIIDTEGQNTLDFSAASYSISLNLVKGTMSSKAGILKGAANFNTVLGSQESDSFIGSNGNDHISGNSGNDKLSGGLGDDSLYGGQGNDTLNGGNGHDSLSGGDGDDTFIKSSASNGQDTLNGGDGFDIVNYDDNTTDAPTKLHLALSTSRSGMGDDTLISIEQVIATDANIDSILAYEDTFGIFVNLTTGQLSSQSSNIVKVQKFENVNGGSGNDYLVGDANRNSFSGQRGSDTLFGGGGDDFLNGDWDTDYLDGGQGNDFLGGGDDDDYYNLFSNLSGHDKINDFSGNDYLDLTEYSFYDINRIYAIDSDSNYAYDSLKIVAGKNSVTIGHYFSNTSPEILEQEPGAGTIEIIAFAEGYVDFDGMITLFSLS